MQGYNSPLSFHPEVKDLCQVAAPNHLQKQVPLPSLFFFLFSSFIYKSHLFLLFNCSVAHSQCGVSLSVQQSGSALHVCILF